MARKPDTSLDLRTIRCVDCKRERLILPQDEHQVTRCTSCQHGHINRRRRDRYEKVPRIKTVNCPEMGCRKKIKLSKFASIKKAHWCGDHPSK